jgi:hypothetical protein
LVGLVAVAVGAVVGDAAGGVAVGVGSADGVSADRVADGTAVGAAVGASVGGRVPSIASSPAGLVGPLPGIPAVTGKGTRAIKASNAPTCQRMTARRRIAATPPAQIKGVSDRRRRGAPH